MREPYAIKKPKLMTSVRTLWALTAHWTFEGAKRFDGNSTTVKAKILSWGGRRPDEPVYLGLPASFDRLFGNKMTTMDATVFK